GNDPGIGGRGLLGIEIRHDLCSRRDDPEGGRGVREGHRGGRVVGRLLHHYVGDADRDGDQGDRDDQPAPGPQNGQLLTQTRGLGGSVRIHSRAETVMPGPGRMYPPFLQRGPHSFMRPQSYRIDASTVTSLAARLAPMTPRTKKTADSPDSWLIDGVPARSRSAKREATEDFASLAPAPKQDRPSPS